MAKYSIPVWQMDLNAMQELNGDHRWVSPKEVERKVHEMYLNENVKSGTIQLQLVFHTINHSSRVNSPGSQWIRNPLFKTDNQGRFLILSEEEKDAFKKAYGLGLDVVNKRHYSIEELKASIEGKEIPEEAHREEIEEVYKAPSKDTTEFALEEQLEDYIVANWDSIDFEYNLELVGRQYSTPVGSIDLLCRDKDNNDFVIIELKKGRESDKVCGQIQRYMGWIKQNLATEGQNVRGIIITGEYDERLSLAVSIVPNIQIKYYRIKFWLEDEPVEEQES